MGVSEGFGNFLDLPIAFRRTEIDGGTHRHRSHVKGLINGCKQDLVVFIWIGEQFVMVEFQNKRDLVGVFSGNRAQDAQCGCNRIASGFQSQFNDVFRVEIDGVRSKGGAGRVFNTLIHRQYGKVTTSGQSSEIKQGLQIPKDADRPVGCCHGPVHKVGPRQAEA